MREKHPDGESACGYCLAGKQQVYRSPLRDFNLFCSQAPPIHALHVASPTHVATNPIDVRYATIQRPQKATSRSTCRATSI
jgi:hypothetical protein